MFSGIMGDEVFNSKETASKMFADKKENVFTDEELALQIIQRFNICRDTLETMPAFDEHLRTLFYREKQK